MVKIDCTLKFHTFNIYRHEIHKTTNLDYNALMVFWLLLQCSSFFLVTISQHLIIIHVLRLTVVKQYRPNLRVHNTRT